MSRCFKTNSGHPTAKLTRQCTFLIPYFASHTQSDQISRIDTVGDFDTKIDVEELLCTYIH